MIINHSDLWSSIQTSKKTIHMASFAFFSPFLFSLLLLLLVLPSPAFSLEKTTTKDDNFLKSSSKAQAEKLIRQLNLFPKHDINIIIPEDEEVKKKEKHNSAITEPRIVERNLDFPSLLSSNSSSGTGISVQDLGHHAGYYSLPHTKAARMFYFFFESRTNKNGPVIIWLTGGPGCGSELALFYENGPFHITSNLSLVWNDFGWDKVSNIIYVDQPTGTGFSYSTSEDDIRSDETGVSNDLYDFLQAFFKQHPEYAKNDFYITGESYAGHYIPALATRVHLGNKNNEGTFINLKGIAIGNGLTYPETQYPMYRDYALQMKLITQSDYYSLNSSVAQCAQAAHLCGTNGVDTCETANYVCNSLFQDILRLSGDSINYYDIRKQCVGELCYDFSNLENFLDQNTVKTALGVGDIDFVSCSTTVHEAMSIDLMRNLEVGIPDLLKDGIKMLIYAGEYDLICNWLGNAKWVKEMVWFGQKSFLAAPDVPFKVDGKDAGQKRSYGPLTFLKMYNAGHLVPMDQPKASLEMLQRWIQGTL